MSNVYADIKTDSITQSHKKIALFIHFKQCLTDMSQRKPVFELVSVQKIGCFWNFSFKISPGSMIKIKLMGDKAVR